MKSQTFYSLDPIFIISFLSAFKPAFDMNGVHERDVPWWIHLFMKRPVAAELSDCIALCLNSPRRKEEGTVTSYCEAVFHLGETWATDEVIAKTNADMMCFTQPLNKATMEYAEALCIKLPR